ncbi:MAG TPA: AAA-like domain-containing protein [Pyrinomonadaceae bacterium]|nr:AAA-like domain-containing protein [Pyrinomonadaceae bacterium]
MSNQNVFSIAGGSVQANNGLYIPRAADDELLELCRASAFTYVLTPRQMGKSSLMERTAERLADEGSTSIIIDLQAMGVGLTAEQWYFGLVTEIAGQRPLRTNVAEWWRANESLGFGQRLTIFFRDVLMAEAGPDERVVIFVDEIDTTLSLKFSDDFFTAVRSTYGARAGVPRLRRLSFVLIGVATPTDLISDPRRTPFNIGQRVDLTDFTFEEALPLAAGLGLPQDESREVLRWALAWTGGHPFLTQQLCAAVAARGKASWTERDVDAVVAEKFLGEDFGQNSNLMFVRDMLTKRAPDRESVLNTYAEVLRGGRAVADEGQSVPKAHLKLSGVVCAEDGLLRVRNPIYREVFDERWVRKHNPPNWTKRLTRAAAALAVAVLVLNLPVAVFALYQWQQATAALDEAIRQRYLAERARGETDALRRIAEERRLAAEEQRRIAEEARAAAEVARNEAEKSASLEKKAKTEVEAQRNKAVAAAAEAEQQRKNAEREKSIADQLRYEAVQQKKLAEQAQLVTQSLSAQKAGNYQHAALLAREALRRDRFDALSTDAYQALSQSLSLLPRPLAKYEGLYSDVALSDDGQYLLSALRDDPAFAPLIAKEQKAKPNTLAVYDAQKKETAAETFNHLTTLVFSPDKKYLLTSDVPFHRPPPADDKSPAEPDRPFTAKLWQWSGGSLKETGGLALGVRVEAAALSPGGKLVAVVKRAPLRLTRARGADVYRPAGFFSGGAQEGSQPFIEVRKVDEPASPPLVLSSPMPLGSGHAFGLAFSGDGSRLVLVQSNGFYFVWARDGETSFKNLRWGARERDDHVTAFSISPDGKWFAMAGDNNAVFVSSLSSQRVEIRRAAFRDSIFADAVFAGAYADPQETADQAITSYFISGHTAPVNALAFAPDSEHLATASNDGTARLWRLQETEAAEVARMSHEGSVHSVGFGAGGSGLVTASTDGTTRVWEVPGAGGSLAEVVFAGASVAAESENRRFVLLKGAEEFRVWDVDEGKFTYSVEGKSGTGRYLTSALQAANDDTVLYLADDGRHLAAYTPDEEGAPQSAQSSTDWWLRLLDLAEGRELWRREGEVPEFVEPTFSPNGKYLALQPSGGADFTTLLLDVRDGKEVLSLGAQEKEYFDFHCFTSDGDHLVVAYRDEREKGMPVRVLEVRGGRQVGAWQAEIEPSYRLTPSVGAVKGGYVGGVDKNHVVMVWEAFSGRLVNRMDLAPAITYPEVVFSPDGEHFATFGEKEMRVWKLGSSQRPVATIPYKKSYLGFGTFFRIFYNSTGEFFYASTPGLTGVWNALTGCEVARVEAGGEAFVNRDGTRVLTVDAERSGAVWRKIGLNDLLGAVCAHVTRNLSLDEWQNSYRLSGDAPPLRCENVKDDRKDEAADVSRQGNSCNLPAVP